MKFDNNNTTDYTITSVNYVDKNAIKENFFKIILISI